MSDFNLVITAVGTVLTALYIGPILLKLIQSRKEKADTHKTDAEIDSLNVATAREVVNIVGEQMERLVEEDKRKEKRIQNLEEQVNGLRKEFKQLEERERLSFVTSVEYKSWAFETYRNFRESNPNMAPPPGWTEPVLEGNN